MALKVLHLSTYATNGGAARAASALHRAMLKEGLESRLVTAEGPRFTASRFLDRQLWRLQQSPTPTWRSPARCASLTAEKINRSSADVVNLHWITDGFLSVEEIAKIKKPLVWSMYDMWPFSGTEHYGSDMPDARWRTGYTHANRPRDEHGFDLDRWTYERKVRHWPPNGCPIHMVPASAWLEDATRSSALMANWEITRIPHVIDTEMFAPMDAYVARRRLGIPEAPTITFLASAGIQDKRKGWDLLEEALPEIEQQHPRLQVLIVGPTPDPATRRAVETNAQVSIYWNGPASDSSELRLLYSAGEITVVPSREDNMPLTAMEAQSCGRPVVGFRTGGLPDIIEHGLTGWLADPNDPVSLASAICQAFEDPPNRDSLGLAARLRADSAWSSRGVVPSYQAVYQSVAN